MLILTSLAFEKVGYLAFVVGENTSLPSYWFFSMNILHW